MLALKTYLYLGASCALFASGWYVNDLRRDSIDYEAEQVRIKVVREARTRADNAERIAAETRATIIVKEKVITNEIIKYVTSERTVCEFDADWLRIRTNTLRAADPRSTVTD